MIAAVLIGLAVWAIAIERQLYVVRQQSIKVLPKGTYVEFDTDEYLGEIDDANMNREQIDIEENTQEDIA